MTTDCTPRYCLADPERGRPAGGGRGLAQPDRGRRDAAGDHRLPELRQPGEAGDHGPVRRLHRGDGRGLPRARLPGRLRQRLALQRDQRRRPFRRRRRSAASACSRDRGRMATHRAEGGRRGAAAGRRRRRATAGSASRSTCARSRAARKARRRRSTSRPSGGPATSCAR